MDMASTGSTIEAGEAAHFGTMAADWWDPKGSSAMLHKLNPVRLAFVRDCVNDHFGVNERTLKPLAGKSVLDVGCGAGLMCEPLARMGAAVTGIDAAPENVDVAAAHGAGQGLDITYWCGDVAEIDAQFDVVTSMEVIEHVSDPAVFLRALARCLKPGGLMILSTPNRTRLSKLGIVRIGESIGGIPKGTHDWDKFITPDEMVELAADAGFVVSETKGISFNPARGFQLSENIQLNYLMRLTNA
jgi:2-polyprenyl-6-hydroxyphenyl methylase / 3-demethylubiquinone-9 3-methyltransferase